jgi:single-strand DNA-binding protein
MSYHKTTIIGFLGSDPEMRFTPQGIPVCNFSVASNRKWTNSDGSKGEETIWFRITAWNKLAELCNQYLQKGRQVFIEGQLVPDKDTGGPRLYVGNDGQSRSSFELRAEVVRFLNGGSGDSGNGSGMKQQRQAEPESSYGPIAEEEIPF